jgi:hypothetical protein
LSGKKRQLAIWTEVATGMEVGDKDAHEFLDAAAWRDRKKRLERLGGNP